MKKYFEEFQSWKEKNDIQMRNCNFNKIINRFHFLMIQSDNYYYATNQKKNNFAIITIDYCKVEGIIYLIICFDECVIIIDESDLHLINNLFYNSNDSSIFILNKNASNILLKQINSNDKFQFKIDSLFENFLDEFLNGFQIKQPRVYGIALRNAYQHICSGKVYSIQNLIEFKIVRIASILLKKWK